MGILKPIINGVIDFVQSKAVRSTVTSTVKSTDSTIAKATVEVADAAPDFLKGLKEAPHFTKLSPKTQEVVIEAKKRIWEFAKTQENSQTVYENITSYIDNLVKYGDDEKLIADILKNNKNFNTYKKNKIILNNMFKKAKANNFDDRQEITTNILLMFYKDKNSYKNLIQSKGYKEIVAGRLSLSHLKGLKSSDVIDPDYFYRHFERLELDATKRLAAKGFDEKLIKNLLKEYDNDLLQNPEAYEKFLKVIESIDNPEVINTILKKFPCNEKHFKYQYKSFVELFTAAKENPTAFEKTMKMIVNEQPNVAMSNFKLISNAENFKISDELFEQYLAWERKYPQSVSPSTLNYINKIIKIDGVDDKFVKEIFECCAEKKINFEYFAYYLNDNSFPYFKKFFNTNEFNTYYFERISASSKYKNPESWNLLGEEYEKAFKPLFYDFYNMSKSSAHACAQATNILKIKDSLDPKTLQELEDLGVFDLIAKGKFSPVILENLSSTTKLSPEIIADLKLIKAGKTSAIKHFDSTKDILRQTSAGDVVSVNGKMYINNNGQLEPWNMTEEAFDKLFPLGNRFITKQTYGNCYFISIIKSLYENPRTRGTYYKMFEQVGDDIQVTIPAYKDYKGTVIFPKGNVKIDMRSAKASKHVHMLEQTYERTAIRVDDRTIANGNYLDTLNTDNIAYLHKRTEGGFSINVLNEMLADLKAEGKFFVRNYTDKKQIENALNLYSGNPRYIINESHWASPTAGHAISIRKYDPVTRKVTIADPNNSSIQTEMDLDEMFKNIKNITVGQIA